MLRVRQNNIFPNRQATHCFLMPEFSGLYFESNQKPSISISVSRTCDKAQYSGTFVSQFSKFGGDALWAQVISLP
jgi:hypothetical protein